MARETLTRRQSEILELIRGYVAEEGCPPTRAEIAATLGFRSANAAEDHLRLLHLRVRGAVHQGPGADRSAAARQGTTAYGIS